jgi:hypothetical protein
MALQLVNEEIERILEVSTLEDDHKAVAEAHNARCRNSDEDDAPVPWGDHEAEEEEA